MSSIKFSKLASNFNFLKVLKKTDLPAYAKQYIKQEKVLTIYKTKTDHGVFTDKKIVLFDNRDNSKSICTIPYKSISNLWVTFYEESAYLNLLLYSGCSLNFHFSNMTGIDKLRLRLLYTCMDKLINDQEPIAQDMEKLMNDDLKL